MRNRTDTARIDVKSKKESEENQSPLKFGWNPRMLSPFRGCLTLLIDIGNPP
jgi:hypothetical protein